MSTERSLDAEQIAALNAWAGAVRTEIDALRFYEEKRDGDQEEAKHARALLNVAFVIREVVGRAAVSATKDRVGVCHMCMGMTVAGSKLCNDGECHLEFHRRAVERLDKEGRS